MTKNDMLIAAIWAETKNGYIGMKGKLPWEYVGKKLSGDLPEFQKTTIGNGNNAVIFGKITLASFGNKALPDRVNIVLSRDPDYISPKDVRRYFSYNEAINALRDQGIDETWVCGGKKVYELALKRGPNQVKKIVKTITFEDFDGDVIAPEYDPVGWKKYSTTSLTDLGYMREGWSFLF